MNVTPHLAESINRRCGSAIDARTTCHPGHEFNQHRRKQIGQSFGWAKQIRPMQQVMLRGLAKVNQLFVLTMAA